MERSRSTGTWSSTEWDLATFVAQVGHGGGMVFGACLTFFETRIFEEESDCAPVSKRRTADMLGGWSSGVGEDSRSGSLLECLLDQRRRVDAGRAAAVPIRALFR